MGLVLQNTYIQTQDIMDCAKNVGLEELHERNLNFWYLIESFFVIGLLDY